MLRTSNLLIGSMAIVEPLSRAAGQASEMQASDEFQFELLHQTLVSITQRYGTNVMSTVAFLILASGRIITCQGARQFCRQNLLAYRATLWIIP